MSKAHKGSRLILKDQVIAVPFESTHFDYNVDATGIYLGDIVEPLSDSKYMITPFEGRFGGGIVLEEGTTNLYTSQSSFKLTGVSGGYDSTTGEWTITCPSGSTTAWRGMSYTNNNAIIPSGGGHATISYEIYAEEEVPMSIDINNNGRTSSTGSNDNDVGSKRVMPDSPTIPYEWKRVYAQYVMENTTQSFYDSSMICFANGWKPSKDTSVKVRNIQFELKQFPTSFTANDRSSSILKYSDNIINHLEGSISFWYKPHIAWESRVSNSGPNETDREYFFEWGVAGQGNALWARRYRDSTPSIEFIYNNTNTYYEYSGKLIGNKEVHIAFTYKHGYQALYVDGKKVATNTASAMSRPTSGVFSLGKRLPSYPTANGVISDFAIFNKAISDEEVEAIFTSNSPLYNPYDYRSFSY